jgi:hypothetical protein
MPDSAESSGAGSPRSHDLDDEPLDAEDVKLVTLARATRLRTRAAEGAAVRDETGRTYTAASVTLPSLSLSALRAAVVLAAASGATSLEAAAVVRDDTDHEAPADHELPIDDVEAVHDLGGAWTPIHVADADGVVRATVRT